MEAFNKAQIEWCRRQLHGGNIYKEGDEMSKRRVDDMQILLQEIALTGVSQDTYFEAQNFPTNYLEYKRVSTDANQECCPEPTSVTCYLAEEANVNLILRDPLKRPDFEWRETFCTMIDNTIRIYKTDFKPNTNPENFIPNRVLSISRIVKQKNLSLLIKALSKTNYGLDIVGDGEMKEIISNEAKNLKVDVRFLGIFSNEKLANIYNQYPIYVICSNIEGNPKTLLESMACGNAIIGTNVTGINNIIVSKENGLLCEKNEEEIREAIIYLMKNPDVRKTLGNAAREKILKENSIQKFVDKEFLIYKNLLKIN